MTSTQIAYRQAAVQGASGFGLLISLYDSLIADLVRAAEAQQSGRIERRANQVNHALLILGFMENWIDPESGGELATPLLHFYAELRSSLLVAQARQSVHMLQQHIPELLHLRSLWQEMELGRTGIREEFPGIVPQTMKAVHSPGAASSWNV